MSLLFIMVSSLGWASSVGSTGDYSSVQDAVDAATTGETITIESGTYVECIDTLGKDLIFEGNGSVLLDTSSCSFGDQSKHGVNIELGESVTFKDLSMESSDGGVIFLDSSTLAFDNVDVSDSGSDSTRGAAVYAINQSSVAIQSSSFSSNGGTTAGTNTVKGAVIYANEGVDLSITNSYFDGNFAYQGGVIAALNDVEMTISDSEFVSNSVLSRGGVILFYPSSSTSAGELIITNSIFTSNTVYTQSNVGSSGGAIYVTGATDVQITGSTFQNNSSKLDGGVAYLHGLAGTAVIENCIFENNSADGYGGTLHGRSDGSLEQTHFDISGSQFSGGDSQRSGGFIALGTPQSTDQSHVSLSVVGSRFDGAEADNSQDGLGGAISIYSNSSHSVNIESSHFLENRAELAGGALYINGVDALNVVASSFLSNETEGASSTYDRFGGAIFADGLSSVLISNSLFGGNLVDQGNSSDGIGGALYLQLTSEVNLYNNIFAENQSTSKGGAIALDSVDEAEILNNNILNTTATDGAIWLTSVAAGDFINNAVVDSSATALVSDTVLTATHNDWYNNTLNASGSTSIVIGTDNNMSETPEFTSYTADGVFDNDDYALQCTSLLIDAGLYSDSSSGACTSNDILVADIGAFGGTHFIDLDGDGYSALFDCEDDPLNNGLFAFPGAAELESTACMLDADEDGYGDMNVSGNIVAGTDCDDSNDDAFPGAAEEESAIQCMLDADSDGYGAEAPANSAIAGGDDCDDGASSINPGAVEDPSNSIDENCDGSLSVVDSDGDGYSAGSDCDDSNPDINSAADEVCDGVDNNCDSLVDESTAIDAATWYIDVDEDGYGEDSAVFNQQACSAPDGYVDNADDCSPFDPTSYPGGTEIAGDGIDQDCDGSDLISEPSSEPSNEPSEEPSSEPSEEPSSEPSEEPSSEPSEEPSEEPSSEPSEEPSGEPEEPSEEVVEEDSGLGKLEPPGVGSCSNMAGTDQEHKHAWLILMLGLLCARRKE